MRNCARSPPFWLVCARRKAGCLECENMTDRGPPIREELKAEYEAGRSFERRFGERGQPDPAETGRLREPRSWLARTSDELKSWFGDQNAQRRRQWDEAAGDHRGQGPAVDLDEDARITADLSAAFSRDVRLDASDIRIGVRDGAVSLDGTVRINADRALAEAIAHKIRGVVAVSDHLTVA
jgi:hypothetical protein